MGSREKVFRSVVLRSKLARLAQEQAECPLGEWVGPAERQYMTSWLSTFHLFTGSERGMISQANTCPATYKHWNCCATLSASACCAVFVFFVFSVTVTAVDPGRKVIQKYFWDFLANRKWRTGL